MTTISKWETEVASHYKAFTHLCNNAVNTPYCTPIEFAILQLDQSLITLNSQFLGLPTKKSITKWNSYLQDTSGNFE